MLEYTVFHKLVCVCARALMCAFVSRYLAKKKEKRKSGSVWATLYLASSADWQIGLYECHLLSLAAWAFFPLFLLPLSFLPPPSLLPITPLQWWPAGQGIFYLHLPYLGSCTGRPSLWIKSTHCSITVPTIPDGSAVQVCLPCARGSLWQCEVKMPEMAASALCPCITLFH